jgi:hypothetical protein
MTRETLIENIENLKRWFEKKYPEIVDTDLEVRMGTHIAEARLILKLQNHIDDSGIEWACDILYRAYEDVREINKDSKYKYFLDETFIFQTN